MAQTETSTYEVFYLTFRDRTGSSDPRFYYGDNRSDAKAGICRVSGTNLSLLSSVADKIPFYVPDEILRITDVAEYAMDDALDELERYTKGAAPTVYVHGFNMGLEKACRRAAVFQQNAGLEGRLLLVSWPSDGSAVSYTHDEADLIWSVPDISDLLALLADRFGQGEVNVIGHSLGGRGVVSALYDMAGRHPDVRLKDVVLMAPDIDFDLSVKLVPVFRPKVQSITLYVHGSDRPLALSEQLHGHSRLGQAGNDVGQLEGVTVVDLSGIPVASPTGHLFHLYDSEVGEDIDRLLNAGQAPTERGLEHAGGNLWLLAPDR